MFCSLNFQYHIFYTLYILLMLGRAIFYFSFSIQFTIELLSNYIILLYYIGYLMAGSHFITTCPSLPVDQHMFNTLHGFSSKTVIIKIFYRFVFS